MGVEDDSGVHSKERMQTKAGEQGKSKAEQYAEHHKLDFSKCDSKKVEDRGSGKVQILEG